MVGTNIARRWRVLIDFTNSLSGVEWKGTPVKLVGKEKKIIECSFKCFEWILVGVKERRWKEATCGG